MGNPVITTRDQAIEQALFCDSYVAIREQLLTKGVIAADPDMVIVEPYASQQEAFAVYEMGWILDKGPPVWVVIVKGQASVKLPGLSAATGPKESDGVTLSHKWMVLCWVFRLALLRSEAKDYRRAQNESSIARQPASEFREQSLRRNSAFDRIA